jgi:hypothetical protein
MRFPLLTFPRAYSIVPYGSFALAMTSEGNRNPLSGGLAKTCGLDREDMALRIRNGNRNAPATDAVDGAASVQPKDRLGYERRGAAASKRCRLRDPALRSSS